MSLCGLLIIALSLTPAISQDVKSNLTIYYDMDWKAIPMSSDLTSPGNNIKDNKFRFGPIPCSCQDTTCGCCVNVNMNFFNFSRTGCMNFSYVPNDFAIQMDLLMNNESVYTNSISGKNPPPACIPVPYVPGAEMCIRVFDVYTEGNNIHMCVNFETSIVRQPILVLQFDCFQMGSDGVSHSKPTESSTGVEEAAKDGTQKNNNKLNSRKLGPLATEDYGRCVTIQ
ncbi:uncharacterized protein [Halyomorpha halys]|uniref:uncharacterized protein isoform X2 n=1 Tax=Halyomorpha halys TaxID=286706 RepID=UPI0006D4E7E4|nr:uncharacterized protein LOC106678759 isoform X2 [Halyomorpha halys]